VLLACCCCCCAGTLAVAVAAPAMGTWPLWPQCKPIVMGVLTLRRLKSPEGSLLCAHHHQPELINRGNCQSSRRASDYCEKTLALCATTESLGRTYQAVIMVDASQHLTQRRGSLAPEKQLQTKAAVPVPLGHVLPQQHALTVSGLSK
jgi:hypothetical protein